MEFETKVKLGRTRNSQERLTKYLREFVLLWRQRGAAKGTFMEEMIFMFQKGHSEDRVRNALERDRETSKEGIRVI